MLLTNEMSLAELKSYRRELAARWRPLAEKLKIARPNQAAEVAYADFESLVSAVDLLIERYPGKKEGIHVDSTHTIRELTEEELVARRDAAQKPPEAWVDDTPDSNVGFNSGAVEDSEFNADSILGMLQNTGQSTLRNLRLGAKKVLGLLEKGHKPAALHELVHLVERAYADTAVYQDEHLEKNILPQHRSTIADLPVRKALVRVVDQLCTAHDYLEGGGDTDAKRYLSAAKG